MPVEFKPSEVGVIITNQEIKGIPFLLLNEAGNTVPAEVLSWFLEWVFMNKLNAQWQIGDKMHAAGHPNFISELNKLTKVSK